MFNSIFRKQFVLYMGTLLISFVILGFAMSQAFKSYFVSQKENMLEVQGKKISNIYQSFELGGGVLSSYVLQTRIQDQIRIIHEYLDASLIFINTDFQVVTATSDVENCYGSTLNMSELQPLLDGEIVYLQGKLNNIFSSSMLTVGYPISINGHIVGAVLLNTSLSELQRTISDVFTIMIICLIVSGIIAFLLIYVSSKTISKPLYEMNEAAKIITSGNFEKRLSINSKDEVGQLGESFNNMAESLYQQERLRQEFISNISHDIRSPLTSMRGFLQAILDGTIPMEKTERYLNIVLDETDRLFKLANDILDLNKIQSPDVELKRENFDICELIRKTVLMFETRILNKNMLLKLNLADDIDIVNADYEKINRVIYNLLDNALKFTQPEGIIEVKTILEDSKIYISVSDNGQGISTENQKYIFERFYKVDTSRGEDKMGSGLGLSIVKAFVKAHGENITVASELEKGAVFTFSLPLIVNKL